MAKSAIYTVNLASQTVAVNGVIDPGMVVRRFGCNLNLSGNAINVSGPGYYDVDANFTISPTAIGTVTVSVYKDNVLVPGMTASETVAAVSTSVNLSIDGLIREMCSCCDETSNLTFVLSGVPATVANTAIVVEKL